MAAFLVFIMATLAEKNCWIDAKGPFGDNRLSKIRLDLLKPLKGLKISIQQSSLVR